MRPLLLISLLNSEGSDKLVKCADLRESWLLVIKNLDVDTTKIKNTDLKFRWVIQHRRLAEVFMCICNKYQNLMC